MVKTRDRRFDWVAALALICGAAVLVPSLSALAVSLFAALKALFWHAST
jgi:hypothetical protein